MGLMDERAELALGGKQRARACDDGLEQHDTRREIGRRDEAYPGGVHRATHQGFVGLPAGRPDHHVDAVRGQRGHVVFDRIRKREINCHVDAAPALLFRTTRV